MVRIAPATEGGVAEWTAALRHCLDRGILTELKPPFAIGNSTRTISVELIVRIMLADLDSFNDLSPEDRTGAHHEARRHELIKNLKQIYELVACIADLARAVGPTQRQGSESGATLTRGYVSGAQAFSVARSDTDRALHR